MIDLNYRDSLNRENNFSVVEKRGIDIREKAEKSNFNCNYDIIKLKLHEKYY